MNTSFMPSYLYSGSAGTGTSELRRPLPLSAMPSSPNRTSGSEPPDSRVVAVAAPVPPTTGERMLLARDRIRAAAEAGLRMRSYEVALDVDMSEFHFARQFRIAFGSSPHVFYDQIRAERARALLASGQSEGEVARRIGFRRPAELRALLAKR